ncbi:MAG: glycosyltransferase family 4 protein [Candidatus Uhrbacteria bacterium]|nr:glycosyltransferase family 4 protein [Candidatus Uhrbacteria bacterium]MDP3793883.1 glycosyltransferase family 4 protein [Candidatus Uhrbacteria bacterium]
MKLLIITQRVDEKDTNLANHVRWLTVLSGMVEEVTVIAQSVGEHHLPSNVKIYSLGKERGFSRPRQLIQLFRFLSRNVPRVDAILVLMVPLYVLLTVPFARVFHKKMYLWFAHKRVSWTLKLSEKCVTKFFSSSRASFRFPSKKARFVGQAIETDFFILDPAIQRLPGKVITVGRITPAKNIHLMIEVVAALKERGSVVQLEIVGTPVLKSDVAYEKVLRTQVLELGLRNQVLFRGGKNPSEVRRLYQEASVFLNVSSTGSLDKAVLEAMACGCPVVVANEAFKPILPAEAFVPSFDIEALASTIDAQLQNPMDGQALRAEVVAHHELRHTLQSMIHEMQ